ncbi:HEPN domain-containing protein [Collinsella sp. AF38-3AC]|uniref:HEPN domain-containing protein n=1 Tax=Collinsella sp. AF38-3AC TaxID=2292015 RepID=UPI000E5266F6|nr:HEPN domain-containing protein [Collinsella sp. AF38-3AC]RHL25430.1 HEPN domain-containing protein [Collinsella sp. AF38-3AC]
MESIFTDHVFPRYACQQVMKSQMNGLNDPTLRDFSLLNSSVLMKEALKSEMFEEEFIYSFLNAARELAIAGRKAIDRPGAYVMLEHSYAIPVLFLTRHCMELAIKQAIRKCEGEPKREHSLTKLWSSLLSRFPGQRCREDKRAISNMSAFIGAIADIDDNGISLRYPKDNAGNLTQDKSLFVNDEKVASYLEKFVEQLELINLDIITAKVN